MSYRDNSFPVVKGQVNLGIQAGLPSGTYKCVADGSITVTWLSDGTDTFVMLAGESIDIRQGKYVEILGGIFHRA